MYSADDTIKSCEYTKTTEGINIDKRLLKPLGENKVTFTPERALLITKSLVNGSTFTEHFDTAGGALFRIKYHYLPKDKANNMEQNFIYYIIQED